MHVAKKSYNYYKICSSMSIQQAKVICAFCLGSHSRQLEKSFLQMKVDIGMAQSRKKQGVITQQRHRLNEGGYRDGSKQEETSGQYTAKIHTEGYMTQSITLIFCLRTKIERWCHVALCISAVQ